ncbi:Carboxy-terminal domain (CTD) phosphatase [Phlyctochytrium planicorne]|nr:Carboxy-terminal domain (CTD) phosphatase [Phlyctochytrium planicorne]
MSESIHALTISPAHLPATIVEIRAPKNTDVSRAQEIMIYEYDTVFRYRVRDRYDPTISREATVPKRVKAAVTSSFSGEVHDISVSVGEVVRTTQDFMGSDVSRAPISMTHDSLGVTVSFQEATRLERNNAERLLSERRLSLILDLDQTVIHATVDPTVGEWLADKENPNFPALKVGVRSIHHLTNQEVHGFRLPETPFLYYIKLRPGTRDFLKRMHELYELHIYTMGTRNYANAVARVLDPDGIYFQDRILSRDDSGNDFFIGIGDINEPLKGPNAVPPTPTLKVLEQTGNELAPPAVGLSMASPGLKTAVLDIENGINESFVSDVRSEEEMVTKMLEEMTSVQQTSLDEQTKSRPLAQEQSKSKVEGICISKEATTVTSNLIVGDRQTAVVTGATLSSSSIEILDTANGSASGNDSTPVFGLEPQLSTVSETTTIDSIVDHQPAISSNGTKNPDQIIGSVEVTTTTTIITHRQRPILKDDDLELHDVERVLSAVHSQFYDALESQSSDGDASGLEADVRTLMPIIKSNVLKGCTIVFSGVIPKEIAMERHEAWKTATALGATCVDTISSAVTHVIAPMLGTAKVNAARKHNHGIGGERNVDVEQETEEEIDVSGTDDIFKSLGNSWANIMEEFDEEDEEDVEGSDEDGGDKDDDGDEGGNGDGRKKDVSPAKRASLAAQKSYADTQEMLADNGGFEEEDDWDAMLDQEVEDAVAEATPVQTLSKRPFDDINESNADGGDEADAKASKTRRRND